MLLFLGLFMICSFVKLCKESEATATTSLFFGVHLDSCCWIVCFPPCYHINADLLLIGLPTATLCLVFFFECAKLFLFLKLLILLFTFDSGKKSRRLSIRFKRLSMVEIPRYSLHLPKMLLANIFSLFAWIQHATRLISSLLIAYHFSDFKNVLGECANCP